MSNRFLKTFLLVLTGVAVGGWVVGVVVYTLNSSGEKKLNVFVVINGMNMINWGSDIHMRITNVKMAQK